MWYWCLHCERAQWHKSEPLECKFSDCGGHIGDLWPYEETRRDYPEIAARWPAIPEEGKVYPLYDQ